MVSTSASASQEDRLCLLVTVGGRADGTRELIAVGGSDAGFWGALAADEPETREPGCRLHRLAGR
jgi:hypothetical protein